MVEEEAIFIEKFKPDLEDIIKELGWYDLYIYYDGKFVNGKDSKISLYDPGVLNAYACFEGIRAYDGKIFKLDQHLDRLYDSAKGIGLKIPLAKEELKQVIILTMRKNNLKEAHIRPVIFRGPGKFGLDPHGAVRPTVVVMCTPRPPYLGVKPIKMIISSVRRKSPISVDAKIKSNSYIDSILAHLQAAAAGMDDAIMLDSDGYVAEATGSNISIVKDKKLYTPPVVACLHGITRDTVMEIAGRLGYEAQEKLITPHDLYTADEVFLTGTAAEIVPVAEIDGRKIGVEAPGPVTKELQEKFRKYVLEEHVTPIYE